MKGHPTTFSHTTLSDIGVNTHAQIDTYIAAGESRILVAQIRNQTGTTLTKGTVIYLSGVSGNKPLAVRAQANSEATSSGTFGVVQNDILTNQNGFAVCAGSLEGFNTSTFAEGAVLWLSPTVAGGFTATKPQAPNHAVYLGVVTRSHATQGSVEIRVVNGYELEELHNVLIVNPLNKQVIAYDSVDSLYKNITLQIADIPGLQTALDLKENIANKNQNNGYAGLDGSGKISPSQLPAIAVTDTNIVSSQSAMLALTAEVGDLAVRTDLNKTFILIVSPASTLGNWQELLTPTDQVSSVYGRTGIVTAQAGDYTADQITETVSNKILTSAERTKLAGIATGATANSSDSALRDRSTHTGTQLASTISDFVSTVLATVLTGLSLATSSVITATDTVLVALGKLQAQITTLGTGKQDTLVSGTNIKTLEGQSLLGSGNIDLAKSDVGLANVDNTSDATKNSATATLTNKTLGSGTIIENATGTTNAQTGTMYTLLTSDNGKIITLNNAAAITLTVPSGLGAGFNCTVIQKGAGQVTFTASSTTITNRQSHTKTAGQHAVCGLYADVANNFYLTGDTTT